MVEEFEARLKEAHEKGTQSEEDTELGRETIEEQERGEAPPTQGVCPALPGNQENQENTLVTPAPRKGEIVLLFSYSLIQRMGRGNIH